MTSQNFMDLSNSEIAANLHAKTDMAAVDTTDATVTTLWSVTIPEQTGIVITAMVLGLRDTHAEAIGGIVEATFRRDGGGNVTIVGAAVVRDEEDSSGTPSFTLDADTGSQTARLRVTGEASKNIAWSAKIDYIIRTT